jgi:hypothetical protein
MKSIKLLIVFAAVLGFTRSYGQSNNNNSNTANKPASDAVTGYTYDWNLSQQLIFDRITAPSEANKDAQPLLDAPGFPAYTGKKIDENYKNTVREWMEKNSALIISTLKHRKDIVTPF